MNALERHPALRFVVAFLAAVSFVDLFAMLVIVGLHAYFPAGVATGELSPMTFVLAGASGSALVLSLAYALLAYPSRRRTLLLLSLLVLGLLGAHLYTINTPDTANCNDTAKNVQGCVMDEVYYVPAAQTMLSGEKCAPFQVNCNLEHPFLSKAFIAAGIAVFGNGTFGWRIFNVILGTFSIPVLFGLCWTVTKNERLSLYAAFLLAFETLFFVHSSIAVIDVGAIFFSLLGFLFYFAKARLWKLSHVSLAGIAFGVAVLCKETAALLFIMLIYYHLFYAEGNRGAVARSTAVLCAWTFLVFAVGMQIYDGAFGAGTATTFIGQTYFILGYGASFVMTPTNRGWLDSVFNTPITPLNWVTYYSPVVYLVTTVKVTAASGNYSYASAGYYGVTSQIEVWLVYLWGAYTVYLWWKTKGKTFALESEAREFRLGRLALVWFLVVFLGYVALYFYGRVTYPYYLIEAAPALAMGAAYLLTRGWFPRPVAYLLLAGVFIWFFVFYPDKSFLPTQLRVWLGH